jgi:hypothetical protein
MRAGARSRQVTTPLGVDWEVGRRWAARGLPRWRTVDVRRTADQVLDAAPRYANGPEDLLWLPVVIVAVIVVAVILIPLLLFGIELILAGLVLAAGILARSLLGRPWIVRAAPIADASGAVAWRVRGWRASARLVEDVTAALAAGASLDAIRFEQVGSGERN